LLHGVIIQVTAFQNLESTVAVGSFAEVISISFCVWFNLLS